jgi:hypothetical protein
MMGVMAVARIALACAINDHRRAFKFSLILWFFLIKKKEHKRNNITLTFFCIAQKKVTKKKLGKSELPPALL